MTDNHFVTREDVKGLLERGRASGVLSVCLDGEGGGWQASHVRSGLRRLVHSHEGDKDLQRTAEAAFDEISGFAPDIRGRSLAYYREAGSGGAWWRSLQRPLATHFVWMDAPFIRPLVAYLDDSPTVGVMVLSQDEVRLVTWKQGFILQESERLVKPSMPWKPEGSPDGDPARGPHAASAADQLKSRLSHHMRRFAGEVGHALPRTAVQESWERIAIIGPSPLREEFFAHLKEPWRGLVIGSMEKTLIHATSAEIADAVETMIAHWNRSREKKEVEETVDIARSGGRAAVEPGTCLRLLQEGRVSRLFFASDLVLRGARRRAGGLLLGSPSAEEDTEDEPYLVERMVALAFQTGAHVTPVEGDAARRLKGLGGLAVRLRY